MTTFRLPILAVIDIAKGFPEPVTLQAQVVMRSKEVYDARVIGGAGTIHSFLITAWTGTIYAQEAEAFALLQKAGDLDWHLMTTQKHDHPLQERSPMFALDWKAVRPSCLIPLTASLLHQLSSMERHILMVVNSREPKTLEEIAVLLNKPAENIYHQLLALKRKQLIDF